MKTDPDSPVVVYQAATQVEATAVANALEAEGIEAMITGNFTSAFQAEAPGTVDVVVRQSQASKARSILDKFESRPAP